MARFRVLFQGSVSDRQRVDSRGRKDRGELGSVAEPIAKALGGEIIRGGLDLIVTGTRSLDRLVGQAAELMCKEIGANPRERIRTVPHGRHDDLTVAVGTVVPAVDRRWQEVRFSVVREADAVVGLVGGKGTSDCIQKAVLAKKPVFPIAVAGGGAQAEWERLKQASYYNSIHGDLDFLNDPTLDAATMAQTIVSQCRILSEKGGRKYSRRIFVIHGHDTGLKNETARLLERIELEPVILHEQPDRGRLLLAKLQAELADVGFALVLLSPDDACVPRSGGGKKALRARQNVVFEYGMLLGLLGEGRVCAIVKGEVELPSDIHGVLYKHLSESSSVHSVAVDLVKELKIAGYEIDANRLVGLAGA